MSEAEAERQQKQAGSIEIGGGGMNGMAATATLPLLAAVKEESE